MIMPHIMTRKIKEPKALPPIVRNEKSSTNLFLYLGGCSRCWLETDESGQHLVCKGGCKELVVKTTEQ